MRKQQSGNGKVERRKPCVDGARHACRCSAFRIPKSAFTLVELLITMAIIAILAGLLLGVAARAGERGREARTKAMIGRLHTLVMEHYDTYKDRRAPLADEVVDAINSNLAPRNRGPALAEARLYALRELMLMEMPDRWSDVWLTALPGNATAAATVPAAQPPLYLDASGGGSFNGGVTPLNEAYRRQCRASIEGINSITGNRNTVDNLLDNQGAECLYMVVMLATADGEARTLFNESSIGDVDGDGAPEFLDAWGRPINFLRWAPGYESDLQTNANSLDSDESAWINQADADHDPFDLFKSDPVAFRMVPLIFSAGSDESYGVRTVKPAVTWRTGNFSTNQRTWGTQNRITYIADAARVNPYRQFAGEPGDPDAYYGTARDETATDNITNHNITSE